MFLYNSSRLVRRISLRNKILGYSKLSSRGKQTYAEVFQASVKNREEFWAEQGEKVTWMKKWDKVLDDSNSPFTKWYPGGEMNTCYDAVDRHVSSGRGDQPAIIHDSPVTGSLTQITYTQLLEQVKRFASVLQKHGVGYGDRVVIYMPMIPQAIIAMLACARLGAIHSLVFGGFASRELAVRISHVEAKVVVSANCGMEPGNKVIPYKPLLDAAIELSEVKPQACIIYNREHELFTKASLVPGRDSDWQEEMSRARSADCVPVKSTDPLYVLYTSGTTGTPKGVVRPAGGHAVSVQWSMANIYGLNPGETWFAASDLGWVVGHSFIVYGPLLHGNTTVLYEGKPVGTPDPGAYFRIISQHGVSAMFTAPTALRAMRREDEEGVYAKKYDVSHFRTLFVAGEHCDHETMEWARDLFHTPVIDHWWQTETGSAMTATCVALDDNHHPPAGVAGKPVPGWDVQILRPDLSQCTVGELGNIVAKLPLPPGCFSTLWRNDEKFVETYFNKYRGYYDTMDAGYRDEHGNICVMARSDDVINVAGHRLSTGQLEEALLEHPDVAEVAVVGIPDKLKGQVPVGLCVLKHGMNHEKNTEVTKELVNTVRQFVGPVASFKDAFIVRRLPKTRSGKIARGTIAAMLSGKPYKIPVTIEDASVYPHLVEVFTKAGYNPLPPQQ